MNAIILAAGIGQRLGNGAGNMPKSLLQFGDESLLKRHIRLLGDNGIRDISIVTGYQSALIEQHLADSAARIRFLNNPHYTEGSLVSLGCAGDLLCQAPFILMDADVLCHADIMMRLVHSTHDNCLLLDQDFIPGEEPVKICVDAAGQICEFGKKIPADLDYSIQGESVGFFKFTPETGARLVQRIEVYLANGDNETPYEDAIRDLLLEDPACFAYEDITDLPWIEIDFPEDIQRASTDILPRL